MSKIYTVAKGEFYRYFISPLAYVYLVCFLLLNSSLALYFGGIFTQGNASLAPMFKFLPWIYLLFIPGISMRLWAEEFKSGTILQISTLPVSINSFVWGKFLAAWAFCSLSLLLTAPFVITLNILGDPDNLVILNSYLGAFLLSGAMLAISQTASALTKNQVIALVLSVFFNFLFMLSGLEYILGFFRKFSAPYIVDMISSFSFLTHASVFASGISELHSCIFFFSLIFVFNFFTSTIINSKTFGSVFWLKNKSSLGSIIATVLVISAFIGINLFSTGNLKQYRLDTTQDKLFTLSDTTRHLLQNLPAKTTAAVYYSPVLGERDPQMRTAFSNLKLLLETYKKTSNNMFDYHILNPEPLSDNEDRAITEKLQALPLSDINAAAYFGIVFSNENGFKRTLSFLPLERSHLQEQDLSENIYLLEHQPKTLGLLSSLPISGKSQNNLVSHSWQIYSEISKFYNIKPIEKPADLQGLDALMIAHPQSMPKEMEDAIYDYSVNEGKILAFFDVAHEAAFLTAPQTTILRQSNYGNLPNRWGFHFFDNQVIADLENSSEVEIRTADYSGTAQDLIQFYLTENNFLPNQPETYNLKRMLATSASSFAPLKNANVTFIPLIKASSLSQILPAQVVINNIHPSEILRVFKPDNKTKYLAAHIKGNTRDAPFDIIAVGDSDILYDSFWTTSTTLGEQNYNIPLLDNGNFVLNALDTLTNNTDFLSLRGKSPRLRPFKKLLQQQKQSHVLFKIKEKDIFDQIAQTKKNLQELLSKKTFENRDNFTPEELSLINKIKNRLEDLRKELYTIRQDINSQMSKTETLVKFFNIYAIPLLIVFGLILNKFKNIRFCLPQRPKFNRSFLFLFLASIACISLGIADVVTQNKNHQPAFFEQKLFPNLDKEINNINRITIQNNSISLDIKKQNNLWESADHPEFLINQARIKSFLNSLLQATIFEKKADKLENLARFGLLPLDNKESKTTSINLYNGDKKVLSFDVGEYNLDLGRGKYGAYIRLPSKFEIWLAAIDFVDLDPDFRKWSFSTLWNLQFGRFALTKDQTAENLSNLASIMLNTKLLTGGQEPKNKAYKTLNLKGEDFDKLTLNFYNHNSSYTVEYQFDGSILNPNLKEFSRFTKQNRYQISAKSMEQIINALNPIAK